MEGHASAIIPSRAELQPPWQLVGWSFSSSDCLVWVNLNLGPFWGFRREQNVLLFSHLVFSSTSFSLLSFNRSTTWGMALTPAAMIHTSQLPSSLLSSIPLHGSYSSLHAYHRPYRGLTSPSGLTGFFPDYNLSRTVIVIYRQHIRRVTNVLMSYSVYDFHLDKGFS